MKIWASYSDIQLEALARAVENRDVHDFGCGPGVFTRALEQLDVRSAVGVEKEEVAIRLANQHLAIVGPPSIKFVCATFEDYAWDHSNPDEFDVGIVSWPTNRRLPGLVNLVSRCKTVVYSGKNTDSTAAGGEDLFEHFIRRKVIAYVPEFRNVLTVYGEPLGGLQERPLLGEEFAALSQWRGHPSYTFADAEAMAVEGHAILFAKYPGATR